MSSSLDFHRLKENLLHSAGEILPVWLPGGVRHGDEWTCGNLSGERGHSLKVNIKTGLWCDFATGEKGGDLTSLYAAIKGLSQGDAFKELAPRYGIRTHAPMRRRLAMTAKPPAEESKLVAPPEWEPAPDMRHATLGAPSLSWCYRSSTGAPLFYVARYDLEGGKKSFLPWSWSLEGGWVNRLWPSPRPLYGLELLASKPDARVVVVEGEKAADAARELLSGASVDYIAISWPSGSKAVSKADWAPLAGRHVILWPDADRPGIEAMDELAGLLLPIAAEVKVINVPIPGSDPEGFDAADAVLAGWDMATFIGWAKPKISIVRATTDDDLPIAPDGPDEPTDVVPASLHSIYEAAGIQLTEKGEPFQNLSNIYQLISQFEEFRGQIWFDEFHGRYFTSWNGPKREWGDADSRALAACVQRNFGFRRVSTVLVDEAVRLMGDKNVKNEPVDWLSTLTWDGVPRIENFFEDVCGTPRDDYHMAAGRNFWISMAARLLSPGCKVDEMVVLEGDQGTKKSSLLGILGGDWFSEATDVFGSKDFLQSLQGKLIVEIAELDSFNKVETNTIKRAITTRVDRFRPPYGRHTVSCPRRCIFVGSTNETSYLRDATGGRRFIPISVSGQINLDIARHNREQYFAEAAHRYRAGEPWWEYPASARDAQEARRDSDPWEEVIEHWLIGKLETTTMQIAVDENCLGIDVGRVDKMTQMRIAKVLRVIGWERCVRRHCGALQRVWTKK